MIPWLAGRGAIATENDRTMHQGAVPKGGGLPLLISAFAAVTALTPVMSLPLPTLAGTAILALISWRDDIAPMPAAVRLPIHLAVAALFVLNLPAGVEVFQGLLPFAADRALAIVALAWMMNLYNFMDGINGIAGVETVAISSGYLLLATQTGTIGPNAAIAAGVLGAAAGFLVWNLRTRPAVFLGDVGSVPLGFLMGALSIDLAVRGYWAAALILPAYFGADATITLLSRVLAGEKPWEAHRTHFYQRAATGFGSHLAVVAAIAVANAVLIAAALWSVSQPLMALSAASLVVGIVLWRFSRAGR